MYKDRKEERNRGREGICKLIQKEREREIEGQKGEREKKDERGERIIGREKERERDIN